MKKEVLLCPPTEFEVVYKINPWMDTTKPVDRMKAMEQYDILKGVYQNHLDMTVHEIPQKKGLPDMIYAANYGHPLIYNEEKKRQTGKEGLFIKSNFKHDERKGEAELAKQYFKEAGYEIAELPEDITWEGQGDLLKAGDIYVLGHGKRTDKNAKGYLAEFLGVGERNILDLQMQIDHFYHVDTALGPIDDPKKNTVVINPKAFNDEDLRRIHSRFDDVIETNDQDNNVLACNLISYNKAVVLAEGISEELRDKFARRDIQTIEVPMTESLKGGGAVKCNTLEYFPG